LEKAEATATCADIDKPESKATTFRTKRYSV